MQGLDDILGEYNPFADRPRTLKHIRIAALALARLEDKEGEWVEHWERQGVNRKGRRNMLKRLRRAVGPKNLALMRTLVATAHRVRRQAKIDAAIAAKEKTDMGVAL